MSETKASDLVGRLRDPYEFANADLGKVAADEIQSLRAKLAAAESQLKIARDALEAIRAMYRSGTLPYNTADNAIRSLTSGAEK